MSNRKKMKDNRLRLKKKEPNVLQRGLAKILAPDDRPHVPTHDEIFSVGESESDRYVPGMPPEEIERMKYLRAPVSPEPVLKVVPARHRGVTVGDAFIHDDGQITVVFSETAPAEIMEEIKATSETAHYSIETRDDGPS